MKIIIGIEDLKNAVTNLGQILKHNTLSILNSIYIKATGRKITMTASDLSMEITMNVTYCFQCDSVQ